jgi:hypothetical protein
MSGVLSDLVGFVLNLIWALLVIGFLYSLVKFISGRPEGCGQTVGFLIAAVLFALWRAGDLLGVLQTIVQPLVSGGTAPSSGALP